MLNIYKLNIKENVIIVLKLLKSFTNIDWAESKEFTLSIPVPKEVYMNIIFETCQFNLLLIPPVEKENLIMAFSAFLVAAKLDNSYSYIHSVTVYRLLFLL